MDFPGGFGSDTRPARQAAGRKPWAKDPSTMLADNGTRLDATFVNDLIGLLLYTVETLGGDFVPGVDSALFDALEARLTALGAVVGPAGATDGRILLFDGTTGKLVKDSGAAISADGTFNANSDALIPTQKAVKTLVSTLAAVAQVEVKVTSRTAMKAVNTTLFQFSRLNEGLRSGPFRWDPTVPFATHQIDTLEGYFVAPNAGQNGAWVRQADLLMAADFGAIPGDSASIKAAIAVMDAVAVATKMACLFDPVRDAYASPYVNQFASIITTSRTLYSPDQTILIASQADIVDAANRVPNDYTLILPAASTLDYTAYGSLNIKDKRLTIRSAGGVGSTTVKGIVQCYGSSFFRLLGLNWQTVDLQYSFYVEDSIFALDDCIVTCPVGGLPRGCIFVVNSLLYVRPMTRTTLFDFRNWNQTVGQPYIVNQADYGSTMWNAPSSTWYTWYRGPTTPTGIVELFNSAQSTGHYLHNVLFTGGAINDGTIGVNLTRGSSARLYADAAPGGNMGFFNGTQGLVVQGGSKALLEGFNVSGIGSMQVQNWGQGLVRYGGAVGDISYLKANFFGNGADTATPGTWTAL